MVHDGPVEPVSPNSPPELIPLLDRLERDFHLKEVQEAAYRAFPHRGVRQLEDLEGSYRDKLLSFLDWVERQANGPQTFLAALRAKHPGNRFFVPVGGALGPVPQVASGQLNDVGLSWSSAAGTGVQNRITPPVRAGMSDQQSRVLMIGRDLREARDLYTLCLDVVRLAARGPASLGEAGLVGVTFRPVAQRLASAATRADRAFPMLRPDRAARLRVATTALTQRLGSDLAGQPDAVWSSAEELLALAAQVYHELDEALSEAIAALGTPDRNLRDALALIEAWRLTGRMLRHWAECQLMLQVGPQRRPFPCYEVREDIEALHAWLSDVGRDPDVDHARAAWSQAVTAAAGAWSGVFVPDDVLETAAVHTDRLGARIFSSMEVKMSPPQLDNVA